jgi:hypothetical protein
VFGCVQAGSYYAPSLPGIAVTPRQRRCTPTTGEAVTTQTQTQQPGYTPRPSPIGDLIAKHRALLRDIYDRHQIELGLQDAQARAGRAA